MKKILSAFLFLLCILGLKGMQAKAIDWEFIPQGINYISKNQFILTETDDDVIFTSYRYIKVDGNIMYWLRAGSENNLNGITCEYNIYNSNKDLVDEVGWFSLNKSGVPVDLSVSNKYLRMSFKYPKGLYQWLTWAKSQSDSVWLKGEL